MKRVLLSLFLVPFFGFAQAPQGYYEGTSTLSGYALKSKLYEIISSNNINYHYGDLVALYNETDLDKYYDYDESNTSILLDMYSEIPEGPDAYEYTNANIISSASAEGQGWNREHMMPQSTFDSNYPMYSDLFFVVPTDARINQLRSNYPYGIAGTQNFHTFSNGSKISRNGTPNSGYTGRVYEPIDEFKGDIARSLLYFVVRYESKLSTFKFSSGTSAANDTSPLDGSDEKAFEDWYIALLRQWHLQDPVSQKEIDRNNTVFAYQKNRNPFIDHPEWVTSIWSQTSDGVIPQSPTNLVAQQSSAYFVSLNWTASPDSDVLGYKIYQNGNVIATTKSTNIIIDHLQPSTTYQFTVRAYDNGYLESTDSNLTTVSNLASDIYAKDLMITKYLEGTDNNNAIEITNKTGHAVDLNKYRLSVQFYNGVNGNYYFPAPYELEGTVQHNETFVILNPYAKFTCIDNDAARFVTAAPQLTFSGSQYMELRYASTTVDAIGTRGVNNYDTLGNLSLYRLSSVEQPNSTFTLSEWQSFPADYCENIGILAATSMEIQSKDYSIYSNPVKDDILNVSGKNLNSIQKAVIFDASGKIIHEYNLPFKTNNQIDIHRLSPGIYILKLDQQSIKFIKQ